MNETDGHEMMIARMRALEVLALRSARAINCFYHNGNKTEAELKELLEQEIEKLAGWRQ